MYYQGKKGKKEVVGNPFVPNQWNQFEKLGSTKTARGSSDRSKSSRVKVYVGWRTLDMIFFSPLFPLFFSVPYTLSSFSSRIILYTFSVCPTRKSGCISLFELKMYSLQQLLLKVRAISFRTTTNKRKSTKLGNLIFISFFPFFLNNIALQYSRNKTF